MRVKKGQRLNFCFRLGAANGEQLLLQLICLLTCLNPNEERCWLWLCLGIDRRIGNTDHHDVVFALLFNMGAFRYENVEQNVSQRGACSNYHLYFFLFCELKMNISQASLRIRLGTLFLVEELALLGIESALLHHCLMLAFLLGSLILFFTFIFDNVRIVCLRILGSVALLVHKPKAKSCARPKAGRKVSKARLAYSE